MGFVPWIPAIVAAGTSLIGGLKGRGEAKQQRQTQERDWAIRRALAEYYLDRRGLRSRLPPALLAALLREPQMGNVPGLGGNLLSALLSGARYAPGLGSGGGGGIMNLGPQRDLGPLIPP